MALTDTAVRNAKAKDKPYKKADERGLYLLVKPAGKYWRFDYRFGGKRKTLAFGVYPDVSLADARQYRDDARKLIARDIDPSATRKAERQAKAGADSFEAVAREWFEKHKPNWAENHAKTIIRRLERDIFPWIGTRPIKEITPPELLATLRRIEDRGALETAHRVLQSCGQIFRYAVATGRAERDQAADLRGALPPVQEKHLAAITDPKAIGPLLRTLDGYSGSFITRCALRLAPLVFVRPGELRQAQWCDIDLDAAQWCFAASKARKNMTSEHIVPLATQAVAILHELQPLTGACRYLFPSARSTARPMSENTVNAALRRMAIGKDEMCGHGFRAMARTILDEGLGFRPEIIEQQLAHAVKDPLGRAYNRTAHLEERRKMMQCWADFLDGLRHGADVVPIRAKR